MDRRKFLRAGGIALAAPAFGCALQVSSTGESAGSGHSTSGRRWGMVVDVAKCREDCTACMDACRVENNLPEPEDRRLDVHYIRKVRITREHTAGELETPLPLLCNHCDNPPCVQVCPVKASFKRDDGIVMCDAHRCIGCRYCLIACPYNARFFSYTEGVESPSNPDFPQRAHGVSQACTFCSHLVDQGKLPACVTACEGIGARALIFGDLNDPDSEISRIMATNRVQGLREDLGTEPKVYYLGL